MNFRVFDWELYFIEVMKGFPRSGLLYEFMELVSDFSISKWILLLVISILFYFVGWRKLVVPIGLSAVATGFADLISHRLVQALVKRPRPRYFSEACNTCECWGFISSHATNVFSVVAVLYCWNHKTLLWTLPIATLVSLSRIYLISHYPLDVVFGGLVGAFIGFATVSIYKVTEDFVLKSRLRT